jgi:hypothetical protein
MARESINTTTALSAKANFRTTIRPECVSSDTLTAIFMRERSPMDCIRVEESITIEKKSWCTREAGGKGSKMVEEFLSIKMKFVSKLK